MAGPTLIIAAGGGKYGFGHWARCLALAQRLEGVKLLTEHPHPFLSSLPFPVEYGLYAHAGEVAAVMKASLAVVDHPEIGWELERAVTDVPTVLRFVDAPTMCWRADYVVNGHPNYAAGAYFARKRACLGSQWACLDRYVSEVRPTRRRATEAVRRVLVALGGSRQALEPSRAIAYDLRALLPKATIYIFGGSNAPLPWFGRHVRIRDHRQGIRAMRGIDLAISHAGQTHLELLAMGVPTLTYEVPEAAVQSRGIGPSYSRERLAEVIDDVAWRQQASDRALETIDGRGADRLAALLH